MKLFHAFRNRYGMWDSKQQVVPREHLLMVANDY